MSYVITWFDLKGRYRAKQYLYQKCADKFAERLIRSGAFRGRVKYDVFNSGRCETKLISKAVRM